MNCQTNDPTRIYDKFLKRQVVKYYRKNKIFFLNNSIDYEDLRQNVLLKVLKVFSRYKKNYLNSPRPFSHWIRKVIANYVRTFRSSLTSNMIDYRKESIEDLLEKGIEIASNENLKKIASNIDLSYIIDKFFAKKEWNLQYLLTPKERKIIILRLKRQESFQNIAKKTNVTRQCVHDTYIRGLKKIRRKLKIFT